VSPVIVVIKLVTALWVYYYFDYNSKGVILAGVALMVTTPGKRKEHQQIQNEREYQILITDIN
jgi:hypothetical protein